MQGFEREVRLRQERLEAMRRRPIATAIHSPLCDRLKCSGDWACVAMLGLPLAVVANDQSRGAVYGR